ncbi:GNAT family N-acetyltransferase [Sphingomonas lutea]|uniref:GNAT family N-acetyltransferase n=1 Tax=Sphingomonas lutea TaxID=1045317 RepID=A0A7G9SK57_9SPHN|nr:GNAT family N-acetyltransferase [Sphingomonas lutea]QNN68232.1 GNAT family N-acetyltransferase [Sphingomonas lutea]
MAEVATETDRLRLRTWDDADKVEFARVTNTPAVMRWLGGVQSDEWLAAGFERIDGYQRDFGHTLWAVERKADGALLGFCGLKRVNSPGASCPGDFEVGWRLREDAWGQGFAKEAAIASLDLAFDHFAAPHVVALTVEGNASSRGLMARLGMTRRADLDFTDDRFGPEMNPTIVYRIDAAEWPDARRRALQK